MLTNETHMHSKGYPNSHINTQCTPSGGNPGVYSRMQMVIKVPNSSSNRLSQASCTHCCKSAMIVAGSGEKVPASSCTIHVQLARYLGFLLASAVVVHHEEHVVSQ